MKQNSMLENWIKLCRSSQHSAWGLPGLGEEERARHGSSTGIRRSSKYASRSSTRVCIWPDPQPLNFPSPKQNNIPSSRQPSNVNNCFLACPDFCYTCHSVIVSHLPETPDLAEKRHPVTVASLPHELFLNSAAAEPQDVSAGGSMEA